MKQLVSVLIIISVSLGVTIDASVASDQQIKQNANPDRYPNFFKVYSKDGRESLTATCTPIQPQANVDQVACRFVNVRFVPPVKTKLPLLTMDDLIDAIIKENSSSAEEIMEDPRKVEQMLRKSLEETQLDFCSPSSEGKIAIEKKLQDPAIGPKRKSYFQQLIEASCAGEDPILFYKRLFDLENRTCNLWVDHFTLEFKKAKEGQWLYRQETPGSLTKVLKVYELTGKNYLKWTLTETRVPTEGSEEKPSQTIWSWEYIREFELPCDFISHSQIQFP